MYSKTPLNKAVQNRMIQAYHKMHLREALKLCVNLNQIRCILSARELIPDDAEGGIFRHKALAVIDLIDLGVKLNPSSAPTLLPKLTKQVLSPDENRISGCVKYYALLFGAMIDIFVCAFNIRWPKNHLPWDNARGFQYGKTIVKGIQPIGILWPMHQGRDAQLRGEDPILFFENNRGFGDKIYQHGGSTPIKFLEFDYPFWMSQKEAELKPTNAQGSFLNILTPKMGVA